ncbi:MAG: hypothetical protein ABFD49_01430 [Armatimonadota bacterium]|nr:hypothetical protein [bacterium]
MKPDNKQIPQLIVLGVLVLICIGYVSFKVISPGAKPKAPAAQSQSETAQSDDKAASDDSAVKAVTSPTGIFPDLASMPARRDPFTPVGSLDQNEEKPAKVAVKTEHTRARIVSNLRARVPRIEANPFNPFSGSGGKSVSSGQVQVQVQEEEPLFTLTGVIRGDSNVAIIRSGEGGRYIAKQGQLIDGRYRIESVSDDGATLVYKNRRIHVKLGGV